MNFTRGICEWRLTNVRNYQYHGFKKRVGNQRNVTMTVYGEINSG